MLDRDTRIVMTTALLAVAGLAHAVGEKVEFSAEAVQSAPQRPTMQAQMYVSSKAVRTETNNNNQLQVEIVFPEQGRRVMLIPQQHRYMEQNGLPPLAPAATQQKNFNPCAGVPDTRCKKLGSEKLQGREAEKWQITAQRDGRTLVSQHWIDIERRLALREKFADGTLSELKILGKEKLNGRTTEKWQLTVIYNNGQRSQSTQWYDPQLQMVIREELPGGYVRELRNIKVAKQAASLFTIPADYQRQQVPAQAAGMGIGMGAGAGSATAGGTPPVKQ